MSLLLSQIGAPPIVTSTLTRMMMGLGLCFPVLWVIA